MALAPAIGIDLGTTYSCVAVYQHDKVDIIANDQGNRTTPSYIAFTQFERLIGDPAKNQVAINPTNTIFDAKRLIGRTFQEASVQNDMKHWPFEVLNVKEKVMIKIEYQGKSKYLLPEEVASIILGKMKETAEEYLGIAISNAVITVPAYFNHSQRQATKDAAEIAGLNVLRIINEPTAAAIAYGIDKKTDKKTNVLIFDLGGGTFDVSILTLEKGLFQVKSTAGDTHLGGGDFDIRMVTHFTKEFQKKYCKDLTTNKRAVQKLRTACEKAKKTLSTSMRVCIEIDSLFDGIDFYSSMTRSMFEELNADLFNRTMDPVTKVLSDAKLEKKDIDDVVLVGGSTRIPRVQKLLQDFFNGKELNKSINPDEAVAYGAAIQASILSDSKHDQVPALRLIDVTPLSLGIATGKEDAMSVVIERNTIIPTEKQKNFETLYDNQTTAAYRVFEGERPMTKDNNFLGEFELTGIPPAPRGESEMNCTFNIDANGILKVTAVEKQTGNLASIKIDNKGRLNKDEIDRMMIEARRFRVEDEKLRKQIIAKNNLESFCFKIRSLLNDANVKSAVPQNELQTAQSDCTEIIDWLNTDQLYQCEEYEQKQKKFQDNTNNIMLISKAISLSL